MDVHLVRCAELRSRQERLSFSICSKDIYGGQSKIVLRRLQQACFPPQIMVQCRRQLQAQFRSTSSPVTSFWVPSGRSKCFDISFPRFYIFCLSHVNSEFLVLKRYLRWPE